MDAIRSRASSEPASGLCPASLPLHDVPGAVNESDTGAGASHVHGDAQVVHAGHLLLLGTSSLGVTRRTRQSHLRCDDSRRQPVAGNYALVYKLKQGRTPAFKRLYVIIEAAYTHAG